MDREELENRVTDLEDALEVAIEALSAYTGSDHSETLEYLERVLMGYDLS